MIRKEKLTVDEHFHKCELELFANKELFRYSDSSHYYKLTFDGKQFKTYSQLKSSKPEFEMASEMHYCNSFSTVDEFWCHLTKEKNWLREYKSEKFEFGTDKIIAKQLIQFHNKFMKSDFDTSDYWLLHKWMNRIFSESIDWREYKQYCPRCKSSIFKNSRYPKYLCGNCMELIVDENGKKVEFSKPEEYDSTVYYLDDVAYFAEEAHMGGIVIQLKE